MSEIVIFGTGGFGREVHELAEDLVDAGEQFEIVGFLDGNATLHGKTVHGLPVLGGAEWLATNQDVKVALGIGAPSSKRKVVDQVRRAGGEFVTLVHPRSVLGRRVSLGEGSIVCAGTIITTDIEIGSYSTFNLNVTIGHDSTIQDFCTFAPGVNVSGNVEVGEGTDFGTNSSIIQGISVGEWSIIGAGASVVKDLGSNITAVGVPAKVIKERETGWHR
jgi:sugar O-acyltransferase (sialic acid O-acetyltransferase NeuD family)